MSQVSYGTITITDTTDIERIYTVYAKSIDNTTTPTMEVSTWSENVSTAPGSGNYIWQRTVVEKSGIGDKTYSDPVCLTGEEGTDATEISGIEVRYGISADWNTQPSSWSADTPAYDSSKPKYWTRTRLIYDTNPVTYSDPVYTKDEALTKAVADAAIANSIAQHANEDAQGAMAQAANGIAEIYRVWYRTNTTTSPSKPSTHVTRTDNDINNTWTKTKPIINSANRYYFYCEETVTNGGISSWTDPVLDTSNLSQYEIEALSAKVKNYWWDSTGAHIASGINGADVTEGTSSTYGFNSLVGLTNITFGYNNYKAVELDGSVPALKFYKPSKTAQGALTATLNSNGLILSEGGIVSGQALTNKFIYLSTQDYPLYGQLIGDNYISSGLTINGHTPSVGQYTSSGTDDPAWRQVIGSKFGVDAEGNLYAAGANIEGAITATQLTISGGGATYDGASAINANGYSIEIIEDKTAAPTSSVIVEGQTYLYPVMYLNGVAVTTGITKTNYIWYTNENTATTGGVAGDSTNGGIIATYGNTYRVTYDLSDDAVGTTPSQSTIHTSDARHITDISSSGITIHPEDGTAGNYMQLDSDGLKIYKSSTLLANYGTTVTIGSSSAKNVYIDSNGVQIRDGVTLLAKFGTTAQIGQNGSSRFLMNSDSLQAYNSNNQKYFEVNANGLSWGNNTAATTSQVEDAATKATSYLAADSTGIMVYDGSNGTQTPSTVTANNVFITPTTMYVRNGQIDLAKFGDQGAQIGEINSYNTRLYSNLFGVYQHNDRIFTISADDEKVEIYAGTSTFNTTSTNGYSESFVQALVWHLQNKFYVGENNINIYEEVTDEDTGLTLETPLSSNTYQVIKVLGINGAPIESTDSMSGDTKYIYCLGSEDNYSFILSEKTAEKLLQRHEFFETYNYILNQCYIGADEKTIYDSNTHLATNYSLTRTLTEEQSHTYASDTEIRNCVMNTSTNTEVWTDDYVNVEYNNHDIQYHIYRLFIECTGTLDNYSFSVNSRYWFTEWAVSSDAKYAGIGSYEVHTIDPDSGQPVDVIEYDNGSVVECTMGGVKTTYSNGNIDILGNIQCMGNITAIPTEVPLTFSQCTNGSYTRCYRIGNIVFLAFNINITTAATSHDYITGLPPALGGGWGVAGVTTNGSTIRFWITTSGTLRADGNAYTGWYNGSITYICQ